MKSFHILLSCLLLVVFAAAPALAQNAPVEGDPIPAPEEPVCSPDALTKATASWKSRVICSINGPAVIQGYRVQCSNATYLDFRVADCCLDGDHWSLKGKNWDSNPNTAVTTSPGPAGSYGLPARIYNYGGTSWSPGSIDAYLECSYLHGVDVFSAGAYIALASDGTCTVTPDAQRSRIDRAP